MFVNWPLKYFIPLANLTTFTLIVAQCVWTYVFVYNNFKDNVDFDVESIFTILTATLGFILPLQLNTAVGINNQCYNNYNAFLGDIKAVAFDLLAFHDTLEAGQNEDILKQMFDILIVMPALVKWHFRIGGADIDKLTVNGQSFTRSKIDKGTIAGNCVAELGAQIKDLPQPELCFFKLLDYYKDLLKNKSHVSDSGASMRSWERAYGAWGNMGNLQAYRPPKIFTYVLNAALFLYSVILPFQFATQGYNAIWMVALIGYFFLGLNVAGSKVGNAFKSGPQNFQTVTSSQQETTRTLEQIWTQRNMIFAGPSGGALLEKYPGIQY